MEGMDFFRFGDRPTKAFAVGRPAEPCRCLRFNLSYAHKIVPGICLLKMEYKKASELKLLFEVFGHFYTLRMGLNQFPCRSELLIRRKGTQDHEADAVIVMMNPGSSKPLDHSVPLETREANVPGWNNHKSFILARPDATQYQIMRLMLLCAWSSVRVINLSDLRDGNSSKFRGVFCTAAKQDPSNPHCSTHPTRIAELDIAMESRSGVAIAAWGQIRELSSAARYMLERYPQLTGLSLDSRPYFRHARPMLKSAQLDWLSGVHRLLGSG